MPLFAHVAVIFGRFLGIFRLSSAIWSQTAVGKRQGARDFEPPVFPVQGFTRTPRSTSTGLDEHPPFGIMGDVLAGQYGYSLLIIRVLHKTVRSTVIRRV